MSSTQRKRRGVKTIREKNDYYVSPIGHIYTFIRALKNDFPDFQPKMILDPASGGNPAIEEVKDPTDKVIQEKQNRHEMSYPLAIQNYSGWTDYKLTTLDFRQDSFAEIKTDFLEWQSPYTYDCIFTNPPFRYGIEFIQKSLEIVRPGGMVIFLLRLNFLGSEDRNEWLMENLPSYIYVHSKRMSFTDNGQSDSVEYAHMIWVKDESPAYSKLKLLPYEDYE